MAKHKLRIEDLTKTYGDEVAVDGLSTSVKPGQLKSLLGPSGCGKTTTLRCVAGLETPDSGRIYIDDELVVAPEQGVNVNPESRDIGMVFQSYAVWPHMTVEENVRYPLKVQKVGTKAEREERVRNLLERVGLDKYGDNIATNLSGGQQQRVAIARALVTEPDLLLFDEPLSNLDAKLRREMRHEIKDLYEDLGITVLYVTHSQDEAMFLSDEIAIMLDGSIVEEGDPVELHTNPQTFFAMNFMGHCNTVPGRIAAVDETTTVVETGIGELRVGTDRSGFTAGQEVYLCFRPKACRILGPTDSADGDNVIEGNLAMEAATRDFIEYEVDVGESTVLVRSTEPGHVADDGTVRFAVAPDDAKVFARSEGQEIIDTNQASTVEEDMARPEPAD